LARYPHDHGLRSRKDVYVEKPLSHTLAEGRKMVQAAAKHNRIVQVARSNARANIFKSRRARSQRKIGKLRWPKHDSQQWLAGRHGNPPDGDPPSWLDWDLWLGPAPYHAYNAIAASARSLLLGLFRGTLTELGVHLLDIVHWAMGVDAPRP